MTGSVPDQFGLIYYGPGEASVTGTLASRSLHENHAKAATVGIARINRKVGFIGLFSRHRV